MKLEDYIRTDEYGERFVAGHRIPLLSVMREHIEHGRDGKDLKLRFSGLSLETIYGVLAYYYANTEEVDRYLLETEAEINRQRRESLLKNPEPTTKELQERMLAKERQGPETAHAKR